MLAPALAALVLLQFVPLGLVFVQSLGFYGELIETTGFWASVALTLLTAIVPTIVALAIGTAAAIAVAKQPLAATLIRLPLVVPYLVGIALVLLLFSNGGLFARLVVDDPADFPRLVHSPAGIAVMLAYAWKQIPFVVLVVGAGLAARGPALEEAAATLGASPWQRFWRITLPQLRPYLAGAGLIVLAFNLGAFEAPLLLGASYPQTLPVEAWRAFDDPDYSRRPLAMATVMVVVLLAALIALAWRISTRRARA